MQSKTKTWSRIWLILTASVVLMLLVLYVVPPSTWLIPRAPLVRGSSGMMILSSPEIEPRWTWLRLRGWIAVPALRDALLNGTDYSRRNAALILMNRRDPSLIPDFENAINKGGDADSLCIAIGYTGGSTAVAALQRIATNPDMEESALRAMAWTKDPAVLPVLLAAFRTPGTLHLTASRALASFFGKDIENQLRTLQKDGTFTNEELTDICKCLEPDSRRITVMRALGLDWY